MAHLQIASTIPATPNMKQKSNTWQNRPPKYTSSAYQLGQLSALQNEEETILPRGHPITPSIRNDLAEILLKRMSIIQEPYSSQRVDISDNPEESLSGEVDRRNLDSYGKGYNSNVFNFNPRIIVRVNIVDVIFVGNNALASSFDWRARRSRSTNRHQGGVQVITFLGTRVWRGSSMCRLHGNGYWILIPIKPRGRQGIISYKKNIDNINPGPNNYTRVQVKRPLNYILCHKGPSSDGRPPQTSSLLDCWRY
jgi:hypothetical protein